jgi:flavin-dependent dehydrogenase
MIEADAVVVGAGPAGAAFALNLAPLRNVLVVDRRVAPAARIGESLAPAARRLLGDMALWDAFLAEGHEPHHGGRSVWGGPRPVEADGLRDLDGPGWHLDRGKFDHWLRAIATARGAALLVPASLGAVAKEEGFWHLDLDFAGRRVPVRARLLVDAGGRGSPLLRRFGVRRVAQDRLVCGWLHGTDARARQAGLTDIEAEADGWWYSASLPGGRRVVAFHTDADLPAAGCACDRDGLLRRLSGLGFLAERLASGGFVADAEAGFCAAHSAALTEPADADWLAIGDAALSFDPLSSQGLFNALYTGLAAAEAADRYLGGEAGALGAYGASVRSIGAAYRAHLAEWYGLERRWADRPFWQRRLKQKTLQPASEPSV